jgi:hypothetical protein
MALYVACRLKCLYYFESVRLFEGGSEPKYESRLLYDSWKFIVYLFVVYLMTLSVTQNKQLLMVDN